MLRAPAFEILDHTAELRLRGYGKTKEELFSTMLLGMSSILKPLPQKGETPRQKDEISIQSSDLAALLVDFLNEILYLSSVNKAVYRDLLISELSREKLKAETRGVVVSGFEKDIKAATHHQASVRKRPDGTWEGEVIFDV
jgi:SHS2 domain-containing protein